MKNSPLSVRISAEMEKSLTYCVNELHKSKTELVQEALAGYLEDLQDYIRAKKALLGVKATYTMDEMKARHGVED